MKSNRTFFFQNRKKVKYLSRDYRRERLRKEFAKYEEFKNEYDDWDPDFVAEFDYGDELLHESYHCWEDFYEK